MAKEKFLTPADIFLILVIVLVSLVSIFVLFRGGSKDGSKRVSVQVDGREVDSIPINNETMGNSYVYNTEFGRNCIHVTEEGVLMESSDCPDQICVHQGEIRRTGAVIVCLPNRFLLELKSVNEGPEDVDAMVH